MVDIKDSESAPERVTYADSKGFSVIENINPGEGFWVNCTEAVTLE